jgi:hypothetical protein
VSTVQVENEQGFWLLRISIDFREAHSCSALKKNLRKEIEMKKEMKPEDIRMAGGALIVGAVIFAVSSISQQVMGFLLSMVLLVIGILGL